jgi:hypothetical protein
VCVRGCVRGCANVRRYEVWTEVSILDVECTQRCEEEVQNSKYLEFIVVYSEEIQH